MGGTIGTNGTFGKSWTNEMGRDRKKIAYERKIYL